MPTPLAHGVAGIAVGRTARGDWKTPLRLALAAFIIAQLPDFDFIPGLFARDVGVFHRGPTHSLMGATLIALPLAALMRWFSPWLLGTKERDSTMGFWSWYAFVLPVYTSHLLLDLVAADTTGNPGLRLWWPLSHAYVAAPLPLPGWLLTFTDLEFGPTGSQFFRTLFSLRGFAVYLVEAVIFSPVLLLPLAAGWWRRRSAGSRRERAGAASTSVGVLESGAEA
jgi:inner membrane protein